METILLKNVKFVENTFSDGSKQLVGLIRGDSFNEVDIPFNPNPRHFLGDVNPNYKRMVKTLKESPELFARKNASGITIFAASCDDNGNGSYSLVLRECDGIANGGHTYHALKKYGNKNSYVKITIEICLNRVELLDIVEALNMSKKIETYSIKNKRGIYNWHKEALGHHTKEVIYHEGDYGTFKINDSLRALSFFYYPEDQRDKTGNFNKTSNKSLNSLFSTEKTNGVKQLKWIAKDVHELQYYIATSEENLSKAVLSEKRITRKLYGKQKAINNQFCYMVLMGISHVGTILNKNNIVIWNYLFEDEKTRKKFANMLFDKIIDIVNLEEGTVSTLLGNERIREKINKQAHLLFTVLEKEGIMLN